MVNRNQRREGAAAIAAPVFDGGTWAITANSPGHRLHQGTLDLRAPLLKSVAAQLCLELGRW